MRAANALRALVRVELREARRQAWRSWLVVLLVAVPVAAMVGGSAVFRTTRATPQEQLAQRFGGAALRAEFEHELEADEVLALAGDATQLAGLRVRRAEVGAGAEQHSVRLLEVDAEHPHLAHGMLRVVGGRAPSRVDEIALAPQLLTQLGRALGETLPVDGAARTICGAVVDPEDLAAPVGLGLRAGPARVWLFAAPPSDIDALTTRLRTAAQHVDARHEQAPPDGFEELVVFVVGGFAFFEAALVIGAAFAVGLRRRQREVGLVGANGASAFTIASALMLSALALATAGIVIGLGLGLGAAHALHPLLDGWNGRWNGPLELSTPHTIGAATLGWIAAIGAVVAPACAAARMPVRVALSGRRPLATRSRGWLAFGLALVLGGFGWMVLGVRAESTFAAVGILGGSILGVLGLGACSPWLLGGLGRLAAPLPLAWRLAARDAGRFRARNGPVVLAVLAGLSVSVMLSSVVGSVDSMVAARAIEHPDVLAPHPERPLVDFALVASVLTGLVVVFVATALSNAESQGDARVLEAVGAKPHTLRTHVAARASYLAALGALLAVPAGLLPSYGIVAFADVGLEFTAPWRVLALALIGLPALAFAGAWLFAGFGGATTRPSRSQ